MATHLPTTSSSSFRKLFSTAVLIAILAVVATVGYVVLQNTSVVHADAPDPGSDLSSTQDSLIDPQSSALLAKIESIQLDESVFANPAFQSLQDYTVPLGTESAGKSNPFAPFA